METLVVVTVTLILSALAFTYNRSTELQVAVFKDQTVIIGVLNRAKSLALQKYRDPALAPDYDFCAFGLHFETGSRNFVLFEDLGKGGCAGGANYRYDAGKVPSEKLEEYSLDPRVRFTGIPQEGLDIVFVPPGLEVVSNTSLPVSIRLESIDGAVKAVTTVSAGGQISTE